MTKKTSSFEGVWVAASSDSDDYNIEYSLESNMHDFVITARDFQVDEQLVITNTNFKDDVLSFDSLIPSLNRQAHNQFRLKKNGRIEAKFTFVESEELRRAPNSKKCDDPFEGKWVAAAAYDEDEYLREYVIKKHNNKYSVAARFLLDGEFMEISSIEFKNETLAFMSFMPSTGRSGRNQFMINPIGNIDSLFKFTVVEELKRVN